MLKIRTLTLFKTVKVNLIKVLLLYRVSLYTANLIVRIRKTTFANLTLCYFL